ncbi:UbiD family decarboxylase domain-containing protein [Anoxybacter fermentans]
MLNREHINLDELPILKCWPRDGGKYMTMSLVICKDP